MSSGAARSTGPVRRTRTPPHIHRAMTRPDGDRAQLVVMARRTGLVRLPPPASGP
ncbi:hypothetical protein ACWGJB_42295 [Streptomyces sp. NPDC054813]